MSKDNGEYPKDLYTATRAEFVTMARQAAKDQGGGDDGNKGCKKHGENMIFLFLLITLIVQNI